MADVTAYSSIIAEGWAPRITEIFDNTEQLTRLFERDKDSLVGNEFRVPVHSSRNEGIGARSERGTLPAAGSQGFLRAAYVPKSLWAQFTITELLLAIADKDEKQFLRDMQTELEGTITDFGEDQDRMFWGDGTGLLGTCGTTTAANLVVMGTAADMKYIRVNMRVDILVKSTGAVSTGGTDRKVTAKNSATTFTIDGDPITTDSTFGVYRQGNKVLTTNFETNGVQNLFVATGALGSLNPATAGQEFWAATDTNLAGVITEDALQKAWDAPAENGWKSSPDRVVISTYGGRREYGKLLQTKKQYVVQTSPATNPRLTGGHFDALDYNGVDFLAERKCPAGHIYLMDFSFMKLYRTDDPGWKKGKGGTILTDDGGTGYVGKYRVFQEVGTNHRAGLSRLTGVTGA